MNARDMQKVLHHLRRDPVVRAVYDAKSEEIGPNIYRFKAEIGAQLPVPEPPPAACCRMRAPRCPVAPVFLPALFARLCSCSRGKLSHLTIFSSLEQKLARAGAVYGSR